jgi:NAD-dependent deacetylase
MYTRAAKIIKSSKRCTAFTGAGISVESGIPPFRGKDGLWNKYDPQTFDIEYFHNYTRQSWEAIREIFYDLFGTVKPNGAHYALAELEANKILSAIITQNVDNLHYDAGSVTVHEFHGSLKKVVCLNCKKKYSISKIDLDTLPPVCGNCGGVLKPNVVFFGEDIPEPARKNSFNEATKSDCFLLIGTTGMVAPANAIPLEAKLNGAKIIEINPNPSEYTSSITDVFLEENATTAMENLMDALDGI